MAPTMSVGSSLAVAHLPSTTRTTRRVVRCSSPHSNSSSSSHTPTQKPAASQPATSRRSFLQNSGLKLASVAPLPLFVGELKNVFVEGPLTYEDFVYQYDSEARVNVRGDPEQEDAWRGVTLFTLLFTWGAMFFSSMKDNFYDGEDSSYRARGGDGTQAWQYIKADDTGVEHRKELNELRLSQESSEQVEVEEPEKATAGQ